MSNFDPIPRLQQIAATIEDRGHFDSPATAAHYINCAIREIERLRREFGEARREIGDSLQTLIHLRQEQNALRAERDEARRECDRLARRNTILIADIEALASAINKATATTGLRVLMYRGEG